MLASGSIVRCAEFENVAKLRENVLVAVLKALRPEHKDPLLGAARTPHRRELSTHVAVVTAGRGDSDDERQLHAAAATTGSREVRVVAIDPSAPDYLSLLDDQCRNARAVAWHLGSRAWPIWRERSALLARAIDIQVHRRGAAAVLCSGPAANADLPGEWGAAVRVDHESGELWDATLDGLFLALRPKVPSFRSPQIVALPVVVAAATSDELTSAVSDWSLQGAAELVPHGAWQALRTTSAAWPEGWYGHRRDDWRPFGPAEPTARTFISDAIDDFNRSALSARAIRFVQSTELNVVPHWYALDELIDSSWGSDALLRRVISAGALVLIDEASVACHRLEPALRALLKGSNTAVVTTLGSDPPTVPLQSLWSARSKWLGGQLKDRFLFERDPRCEVALCHPERLKRWLHLVLPELVATLDGQEPSRVLVNNAAQVLAPT